MLRFNKNEKNCLADRVILLTTEIPPSPRRITFLFAYTDAVECSHVLVIVGSIPMPLSFTVTGLSHIEQV